jgi:2-keto-3-deoxy-L-rhamnonate aldolase RhmA
LSESTTGIRRRALDAQLLVGAFLQTGSAVAAEIASTTGIDWALIDLEHGAGTEAELVGQLHALGTGPVAGIVRVESLSRLRVGRALDLGAAGVMVPQINTPEDARELASFVRYQPSGARGVALSARGAGYGTARHGDLDRISDSIITIAQIETRLAVDNAPKIAATDHIDVLFVGPSDLSHSLGVPGQFESRVFAEALDSVAAAARSASKALGVHIPSISEFDRYHSRGFRFISVGADGTAVASGLRAAVQSAREKAR